MIETTKLNETAATIGRWNVDARLNEILDCCIDYKQTVKCRFASKFELFELKERYGSHFSRAKSYERNRALTAEDFATIERFYESFMIFHRENVEHFLEDFYCLADKGLKTREILNSIFARNAGKKPINWCEIIPFEKFAWGLSTYLDDIVRKCADCSQKLGKHESNDTFFALKSTYDDFSERAMKCVKSNLFHEGANLCWDFGIFHRATMKTHWDTNTDDF